MRRITSLAPNDFLAYGQYAPIQAISAFCGILVHAWLVRIELVAAAIFHIRHIRHDDIRPCLDA